MHMTSTNPVSHQTPIRTDVQALRAMAVLLVILNHLWANTFTGGYLGVDIFFVISGYLITSHLLRQLHHKARIDFANFYARRARRLLPAALLVASISFAVSLTLLPAAQWKRVIHEFFASSAYFQNWYLYNTATDYFAKDTGVTAFNHYWSLSVEEQFYLLWPLALTLIFALASLTGKKLHLSARIQHALVGTAITLLALASLSYAQHLVAILPSGAYFHTFTRTWEFMVGALIALAGSTPQHYFSQIDSAPARLLRNISQLAGYTLVLGSAIFFQPDTGVPGIVTLVPLLGVALVIALGPHTYIPWLNKLMEAKPVQFIGDISYSLYLWHWPLIVLTPYMLGHTLFWWESALIIPASILLAWVTKVLLEDPARQWRAGLIRPHIILGSALASVALIGCVGWGTIWYAQDQVAKEQNSLGNIRSAAQRAEYDQAACFGAVSIIQAQICREESDAEPLVSPGSEEETPWGGIPPECETIDRREVATGGGRALVVCDYSAGKDTQNVWVVGDSHGQQWRQSLLPYAKDHQWKLTFFTHSGCPTWDVPMTFRGVGSSISQTSELNRQECSAWAQETAQTIRNSHPDKVFVGNYSSTEGIDDGSGVDQSMQYRRAIEDGAKSWGLSLGQIVVFRDTPTSGNVLGPACVSVSGANCVASSDVALYDDPQAQAAHELGVSVIDMSDFFCPENLCRGVIGRVPVYYDANHISRSYMQSLAGPIRDELNRVLSK